MTNQFNEENIRVAAYYIWEQAGRPQGKDQECWNKACEQLSLAYSNNECCQTSACKKNSSKNECNSGMKCASKSTPKVEAASTNKKACKNKVSA